MAPRRIQIVLALEVATSWRSTNGAARNTPADPRDEHCKPTVGSAAGPWRASQARHQYRTDERGQVCGQAKTPAVPRLEDLYPQSCQRHRGYGSVCRADNLVSFALRFIDHGAWPAANSMVWRHIASNRGMDRKSDHGSMRLGTSSPLSHPRPGSGLWRGLHPKTTINRHSRSTDRRRAPHGKTDMPNG